MASTATITARRPTHLYPLGRMSALHRMALALVWITIVAGCFVVVEPAPVDLLMCTLFVLLPTVGLFKAHDETAAIFALLLAISALQFLGANFAFETDVAIKHNCVSLYLFGSAFLIAGFIAKRPQAHTRLVLQAYLVAGLLAASAGIVGYLDLFPGAYEIFTRHDRASGPFKDPNVFGPFLIPALLTSLHLWMTRSALRGLPALAFAALLSAGLVLSLSRGAWAAAALACAIYLYFHLYAARRDIDRLKVIASVLLGATLLGLVLIAALQSETVARLLAERAALTQPYDEGPEGRFGGQEKALDLILDNPLGLGGQQFAPYVHHEEPHNVFLNLFLSAGWTGGVLYLWLCATLIVGGFRHALRPTRTRALFVIAYASLVAIIALGVVIDSDHWRHFYLLIGVVTGLMASDQAKTREDRIVRDRRPLLMNRTLVIGPPRREGRIVRRVFPRLPSRQSLMLGAQNPPPPHRPARIRSP